MYEKKEVIEKPDQTVTCIRILKLELGMYVWKERNNWKTWSVAMPVYFSKVWVQLFICLYVCSFLCQYYQNDPAFSDRQDQANQIRLLFQKLRIIMVMHISFLFSDTETTWIHTEHVSHFEQTFLSLTLILSEKLNQTLLWYCDFQAHPVWTNYFPILRICWFWS